jgi:hypothetical protein
MSLREERDLSEIAQVSGGSTLTSTPCVPDIWTRLSVGIHISKCCLRTSENGIRYRSNCFSCSWMASKALFPSNSRPPMVMPRILFFPNLHCLRMENIMRSHKMEDIGDYPVESVS